MSENDMEEALGLLEDAWAVLENYEDADCQGDQPRYVPNSAMSMRQRIHEFLMKVVKP